MKYSKRDQKFEIDRILQLSKDVQYAADILIVPNCYIILVDPVLLKHERNVEEARKQVEILRSKDSTIRRRENNAVVRNREY